MFNCLKKKCLFFFLLVLFTGCCKEKISVHSQYLSVETLASYAVETPDPRQYCPQIGQRLIINWSLGREYLQYEDLYLMLKVRFRNREEDEVKIAVCKMTGTYLYYLMGDDYLKNDGILTYKVDLIGDGEILEEWRHQIWADLISFDNKNINVK